MSPRRSALRFVVAGVLVGSACAPTTDPDLGVRESALDVVYGRSDDAPVEVELDPVAVIPPPVVTLPPTTAPAATVPTAPSTTTTVPPVACPVAPLDALPDGLLAATATAPPAPGTYRQAQSGTAIIGGTEVDLTATVLDEVSTATVDDGSFGFEVVSNEPATRTTVGYRVDEAGLSITSVTVQSADGEDTFAPQPALLVLPAPAVIGTQFSTTSVDPVSGRLVTLNGRITGIERIDVCGDLVDTWEVTFGEGPPFEFELPSLPLIGNPVPVDVPSLPSTLRSIAEDLTITGTAFIAPQLGGLVVGFDSLLEGTIDNQPATVDRSRRLETADPE